MRWSDPEADPSVEHLIVSLIGWISDGDLPPTAIWPPPWPVPEDSPEQIGVLVRWLRLSERQYRAACKIAEDLVEDETFTKSVELIAHALFSVAPHLDSESLRILGEAAGFPEPGSGGMRGRW